MTGATTGEEMPNIAADIIIVNSLVCQLKPGGFMHVADDHL